MSTLALAAAAGCGGSDKEATTPAATATAAAADAPSVAVGKTSLGSVLVDSQGLTLYLFEKDKGPASTCSGACASAWPPLVPASNPPAAGEGIDAAKLGTTTGGPPVVTYAGHPLYTFAGDTKPGDVNGQDIDQFGAEWYALSPDGKAVEDEGDDD